MQNMKSLYEAYSTVGVCLMVLRHGIETFQSYLHRVLFGIEVLPSTIATAMVLPFIPFLESVPDGGTPIDGLFEEALVSDGDNPVNCHSLVEFH